MRVEDPKFLAWPTLYVADITLPANCIACWCARRTPTPESAVERPSLPGVVAVFTGTDLASDKVGPMAPLWAIQSSDGKPMAQPPRLALARGTVRHVGEAAPASSRKLARGAQDAADLLQVDHETRSGVAVRRFGKELHNSMM